MKTFKTNEAFAEHLVSVRFYAYPAEAAMPEGGSVTSPGMTLRDYFAAQAMAAIIGKLSLEAVPVADQSREHMVALGAYGYADAMLKARSE